MNKEIQKTQSELTEQELDKVAGGATAVRSAKSNSDNTPVAPVPPLPLQR